ncbi:MAG: iron-sulfur cluster assembly accessory protein [Bacteroidia bacterium]|nr:iron-sulfur cluster assembly accessory protein [Bacteroidia bacterium]
MEIQLDIPVRFTDGALRKLEEIRSEASSETAPFLRVGVKGGGCSGLSYLLAFDQKTDRDNEYQINDLSVIIEKPHVMYVLGMEIDYEHGLNSRGFVFNNPNAKETCGCGESFSA